MKNKLVEIILKTSQNHCGGHEMGPRGSVPAHIKTARIRATPRKLFRRLPGPRGHSENSKILKNQKVEKIKNIFLYIPVWGLALGSFYTCKMGSPGRLVEVRRLSSGWHALLAQNIG